MLITAQKEHEEVLLKQSDYRRDAVSMAHFASVVSNEREQKCREKMKAKNRLQAVQEDSRPPVSRHLRDSGAGRDSAADYPEHTRRCDRASECQPAASADRRPDHCQCLFAIDVIDSRVSREFHGAQYGLRDDVAVLQAHHVAAVFVFRQAQDR